MQEEWEKYLLSKVELRDAHTRCKKKPKDPKGFGILDGTLRVMTKLTAEVSSTSKQEHDALLAAVSEIRNRAKLEKRGDSIQPRVGDEGCSNGTKGNNKKGRANAKSSRHRNSSGRKKVATDGNQAVPASEDEHLTDGLVSDGCYEGNTSGHSGDRAVLQEESDRSESRSVKPLPPLHFHALESDQPILDTLKPSVIIAYHPDMTFVREIEVYKAENPSKRLKIYFLFYEESTEVQKFEASIHRENGAFESLIRQKSMMMIPVDQVPYFSFLTHP